MLDVLPASYSKSETRILMLWREQVHQIIHRSVYPRISTDSWLSVQWQLGHSYPSHPVAKCHHCSVAPIQNVMLIRKSAEHGSGCALMPGFPKSCSVLIFEQPSASACLGLYIRAAAYSGTSTKYFWESLLLGKWQLFPEDPKVIWSLSFFLTEVTSSYIHWPVQPLFHRHWHWEMFTKVPKCSIDTYKVKTHISIRIKG